MTHALVLASGDCGRRGQMGTPSLEDRCHAIHILQDIPKHIHLSTRVGSRSSYGGMAQELVALGYAYVHDSERLFDSSGLGASPNHVEVFLCGQPILLKSGRHVFLVTAKKYQATTCGSMEECAAVSADDS